MRIYISQSSMILRTNEALNLIWFKWC